jgi:hypothetical protein
LLAFLGIPNWITIYGQIEKKLVLLGYQIVISLLERRTVMEIWGVFGGFLIKFWGFWDDWKVVKLARGIFWGIRSVSGN